MGKHETEIMRQIMISASKNRHRLWRNNVGLFYTSDGIPVRCGLCKSSADLIGITSTGRFLSVEVKTQFKNLTKEQSQWMEMVNNMGGIGICAKTPEEAEEKIMSANPRQY